MWTLPITPPQVEFQQRDDRTEPEETATGGDGKATEQGHRHLETTGAFIGAEDLTARELKV